jgi:hypothetical protein
MYFDDTEVYNETATINKRNLARQFKLARDGNGYMDAHMFDVRIYNKALTTDEVEHVYNYGSSGTDPGTTNLAAHYKGDDTHPTIAYDSSGNARHGNKILSSAAAFHYEGADVPYSWQNTVGFSNRVNYVLHSEDLTNVLWGEGGITNVNEGEWNKITKNDASGSRATYQNNVTEDIGSYVVYATFKAGTFDSASVGILSSGWNGTDAAIISGNGSVDGIGSIARVVGLDANETVAAFEVDVLSANRTVYIYPGTTTSGGAGNDVYVKNIQVFPGTLETTYNGYVETQAAKIYGYTPRDESSTSLDVLGNPLQYSGPSS